jgi:hypothetical protein
LFICSIIPQDVVVLSDEARGRSPFNREAGAIDLKFPAVGGADYGFSPDSNNVTLISALDDMGANDRQVFYVSWLEAHMRLEYAQFVDRLIAIGNGYRVHI